MTARNFAMALTIAALLFASARMGATGAPAAVFQGASGQHLAQASASDQATISLRNGLRATADRDNIPRSVINTVTRLWAYQADLEQTVAPGDSFKLLYSEGSTPSLLAGVLLTEGGFRKVYRFQTSDGTVDYYDDNGNSARTSLLRKPMSAGIMRSGFGPKVHPLLQVAMMHTGVDWAVASGTPVYAAGDGMVEMAGWNSGFGRSVRLRHPGGYETGYSHLLRFKAHLARGDLVRQGDVIGFSGSSGISSGPHLHYELITNSRLIDPLRAPLPHVRVLAGSELSAFQRERDRLDTMLAGSPAHTF